MTSQASGLPARSTSSVTPMTTIGAMPNWTSASMSSSSETNTADVSTATSRYGEHRRSFSSAELTVMAAIPLTLREHRDLRFERSMDISTRLIARVADEDWSDVWRESGAMVLSGRRDGSPLGVPEALPLVITSAADVIAELSALEIDGPTLLGELAAVLGLTRDGKHSCGGGTRLLRAANGWIAVSLARDDDRTSVPAWLQLDSSGLGNDNAADDGDELWTIVSGAVLERDAVHLVDRGRMLG